MSAQSDYARGLAELATFSDLAPKWLTTLPRVCVGVAKYGGGHQVVTTYDVNGHVRFPVGARIVPVLQVWAPHPAWRLRGTRVYIANQGTGWMPLFYPGEASGPRCDRPAPDFDSVEEAWLWLRMCGMRDEK